VGRRPEDAARLRETRSAYRRAQAINFGSRGEQIACEWAGPPDFGRQQSIALGQPLDLHDK
jgi:hypothetical protein